MYKTLGLKLSKEQNKCLTKVCAYYEVSLKIKNQ